MTSLDFKGQPIQRDAYYIVPAKVYRDNGGGQVLVSIGDRPVKIDASQLLRVETDYFSQSEFLDSSAGSRDAGAPVKLNADGKIDASMLPLP